MGKAMGLQDFLKHKPSGRRGGSFLKSWRGRKEPHIDTFLHCHAPIMAVWQNKWQKLQEVKDDKTGKVRIEVWSDDFNSWEDEETNKVQYRYDRETGLRELAPTICPMALLIEEVHRLVEAGDLHWLAPIFQFDADDAKKSRTVYAVGLYNGFPRKRKDLDDKQQEELDDSDIRLKDAWMQSSMAKCMYVLAVVDADDVKAGVQVTTEKTLLGDKLQEEIRRQMKSEGVEDGNPMINPYCLRWEHHDDEEEFHKKYSVTKMGRISATKPILALIKDEKTAPDLERITRRGNIVKLRTSMETHCTEQLAALIDWDKIFGPAEALRAEEGDKDGDEEESEGQQNPDEGTNSGTEPDAAPARAPKETTEAKAAPKAGASKRRKKKEPEPKVEMEPCEDCKKDIPVTAVKCEFCGCEYDVDDEPPAAEAPAGTTKTKPF